MESTNNVDDANSSIIELTAILNELIENSIGLSEDIMSGINAFQQLAISWFVIAFIIILTVDRFGGWTMINIGIVLAVCFTGVNEAKRYNELKNKYSQIIEIHQRLTEK